MITVAIVSPERSMETIQHVIETQEFGCSFHRYVYRDLDDIPDIYQNCKKDCDVIFFSGELGYHYIFNHIPHLELPCSFIIYETKHILSILLNFALTNPTIPLNRVLVDFLTPFNNYMDLKKHLDPAFYPYCHESMNYEYPDITKRARALWDEGKIDFIITRSINNVKTLEQLGIPYLPIFPTEEMIADSLRSAVNEVRLTMEQGGEHVSTIIKLHLEDQSLFGQEFESITMYKLLLDFRKAQNLEFGIEHSADTFLLHSQSTTGREVVAVSKLLVHYLQTNATCLFSLGVGIANTQKKSRTCAENTLNESILHGNNDGFLRISGTDELMGPLSMSGELTYNYGNQKLTRYAKEYGIEERNLVKIMGLYRMDSKATITAIILSQWLNITTRSCNRILQQLLDSGLVTEVYNRSVVKKGRRERQFQFLISAMETQFH